MSCGRPRPGVVYREYVATEMPGTFPPWRRQQHELIQTTVPPLDGLLVDSTGPMLEALFTVVALERTWYWRLPTDNHKYPHLPRSAKLATKTCFERKEDMKTLVLQSAELSLDVFLRNPGSQVLILDADDKLYALHSEGVYWTWTRVFPVENITFKPSTTYEHILEIGMGAGTVRVFDSWHAAFHWVGDAILEARFYEK